MSLPPVELHDLAADTLPEVLVGRADHHLLDAFVGARDDRRARERVVGLEVDHRPHGHAEGAERVLQHRELGLQERIDAVAGLVRRATGRCGRTR